MLNPDLPFIDDPEGDTVPNNMPFVIDTHVHVFPDQIFQSIWNWFDRHAWQIRYRFSSKDLVKFLIDRGVGHIVALQYAHKPGIAEALNLYMADLCQKFPGQVTGLATVFPGEAHSTRILEQAFDLGLKGVKLHAHVQCFDMNSKDMDIIYEVCAQRKKPMVMHVSREPKSEAYACDPYELCHVKKVEKVLKQFPELNICVPHLGVDEFIAYQKLLQSYDNIWLDTAMALTDYFPIKNPVPLTEMRMDRIMYGSDFPNIPYNWDRELKWIDKMQFRVNMREALLAQNAACFFNIDLDK